jgi:dTDP-4-amino-4,6-dideoxygalactose transaminase
MPELSAAIARAQLGKLEAHNRIRDTLFERYIDRLAGRSDLTFPFAGTRGATPGSRHLLPVLLPCGTDRRAFMTALADSGVQSSIHYPAVYSFSQYRRDPRYTSLALPVTDEFSSRVVTLPFHPGLEVKDVDTICTAVLEALPRG